MCPTSSSVQSMFSDRQLFVDTKQVIVPPIQHFLKVDVSSDRTQYQPREEGTLTDHQYRPGGQASVCGSGLGNGG